MTPRSGLDRCNLQDPEPKRRAWRRRRWTRQQLSLHQSTEPELNEHSEIATGLQPASLTTWDVRGWCRRPAVGIRREDDICTGARWRVHPNSRSMRSPVAQLSGIGLTMCEKERASHGKRSSRGTGSRTQLGRFWRPAASRKHPSGTPSCAVVAQRRLGLPELGLIRLVATQWIGT